MDQDAVKSLLESFQQMAKSNQELVAAVQAGAVQQPATPAPAPTVGNQTAPNDMMGAVALTGIKIPLTMGDSAEERLINFNEWREEVMDKLTVAGITDEKRQTTIALMWGGKEIKDYAIEKAGVVVHDDGTNLADTWSAAVKKIEEKLEEGINEAFAMFKFRQNEQGQRGINTWFKQLKSNVKTLRLKRCTCGNGYSEERAIRDVIVALTNDNKLRKDALSKDLSLTELLREGEANKLARSRAATVEKKSVNKLDVVDDGELTDEQAQYYIAKLKQAGKFSSRFDSQEKSYVCDRCVKSPKSRLHTYDTCYFKDQECRACKQTGHMGGSKLCKKSKGHIRKVQLSQSDYDDPANWGTPTKEITECAEDKTITIKKVEKKNVVKVKVGKEETDMYTDSGSDVNVCPSTWYKKGMGKLEPSNAVLQPYGAESDCIPVEARFQTTITTQRGAKKKCWVYVVNSKQPIEPLMSDSVATELGFLKFLPDGREPTEEELKEERSQQEDTRADEDKDMTINKVAKDVKVGQGTMPDSMKVPEITEKEVKDCWEIIDSPKYAEVFDPDRIGKMINRAPITLHGKEDQRIISQPMRPIPPQFREELSTHLEFLRKNGKIVDVDPNTETVECYSNVVISRKSSGDLRMNLDARPVNAALCDIVSHQMVTPEDVRHEIAGSTRYSEFDMNHGYNQSTLSEESSKKYGVFQTHEGFHRFTGLYFGHKQSSQAFDADVKTCLRGLSETKSVADNIMVHGKTPDQHKKGLIALLDRCLAEGITLKRRQVTLCKKELLWFGYVFGKEGLKPDPAKVQKLKDKGAPTSQEEVRSFLQAAQFNVKFMWDTEEAYSHITQPLRKLLGKNVRFVWGQEQQDSYNKIINALDSAGALYPYNPELEIVHVADAQPTGIASSVYMVTKNDGKEVYMVTKTNGEETWWPLDHISRSLTPTESGYPQIDRESLAQAWGMRQHRHYLIGRQFLTYCDHQPLLAFYNGRKRATPRVERHILTVQDLDYKMVYMAGKDNPADWNSRHPESIEGWSDNLRKKHQIDGGEEIRLNRVCAIRKLSKILENAGIVGGSRVTEKEIEEEGLKDEDYNTTRELAQKGKHNQVKGEYKRISKEISADGNLMIRGKTIVVPKGKDGALRRKILDTAHEGHPGMSQLKAKLRDSVFWPGITKDVEERFKPCLACQATTEGKMHADKLHPSEPPDSVWEKVGSDHWGPLPDGSERYILVVQDYLTKYPEAIITKGTAAKDNIGALEEIFGRHGYPKEIITDNGPPWNGLDTHEMKQYLAWAGVKHSPTRSADDPEANGLTERFMQTIGKSWATAYVENRDPMAALNAALKSYRNTAHSITQRKPAEWLFGRAIRTRLPQLQTQCEDKATTEAKERMRKHGESEKKRHDQKAREESIEVGMQVLLKRKIKKKGMSKYDPRPFTVTEIVGRQAVLERDGAKLKRETQKFKRFYPQPEQHDQQSKKDDWEEGSKSRKEGSVRSASAEEREEMQQAAATVAGGMLAGNSLQPNIMNEPATSQAHARTDDNRQTAGTEPATATAAPRRTPRTHGPPDRYGAWVTK